MAQAKPITGVAVATRALVREAATTAMQFWPNAHLGDYEPREDLRSAFSIMRRRVDAGETLQAAASYVLLDALNHQDM